MSGARRPLRGTGRWGGMGGDGGEVERQILSEQRPEEEGMHANCDTALPLAAEMVGINPFAGIGGGGVGET
eukprot:g695.t1